jgi:predicted nucleotidyltransferase
MYGLTDHELEAIRATLRDSGITEAVLFGSRAKGDYRPGSDIDIAVDRHASRAAYLLNEETTLPYYFDIIELDTITNPNLLAHIKRVGKPL